MCYFIGNKHMFEALVYFSGRDCLQLSKPSPHFLKYLEKQENIEDPKRTLVIGDS